MQILNKKQTTLLDSYVKDGKSESYIKEKILFFGVNPEDQQEVFAALVERNRKIDITELDKDFKGLQIATEQDLNKIANEGYTGDWKLDISKARECEQLRIFSMTDRGLYIVSRISKYELLPSGKYKIHIEDTDFNRLENENIKFTRNVVRYIHLRTTIINSKNK